MTPPPLTPLLNFPSDHSSAHAWLAGFLSCFSKASSTDPRLGLERMEPAFPETPGEDGKLVSLRKDSNARGWNAGTVRTG